MAKGLLYFDGFDASTDLTDTGWTVVGPSYITVGTNNNRWAAGNTVRVVATGTLTYIERVLPTSYTKLIVGLAMRVDMANMNGENLLSLYNGGTEIVGMEFTNTSGDVIIKYNNEASTIAQNGTSQRLIVDDTWCYVELKVWINGTSSLVEVKVNGNVWISNTNCSLGSVPIDRIVVGQKSAGHTGTFEYDDLVVIDWSVSGADYLGERRCMHIVPTGAGNYTTWTATGTASNWDCVNETNPDDDTTYVTTQTSGEKDSYALGDLSGIDTGKGRVDAVQTMVVARAVGVSAGVKHLLRLSSTDATSAVKVLTSSYQFSTQVWEDKPGGSGWTVTDVNNLEAGIQSE